MDANGRVDVLEGFCHLDSVATAFKVVANHHEGGDPGFCTAELDFQHQHEVREKLPSLANRVASAYAWPEEARV